MASFSTVISEYSDKENHRTYSVSGHSVQAPRLLIVKRKPSSTVDGSFDGHYMVVYGTSDAEGRPLSSKVVFDVGVRYPIAGDATDVSAALAVFRDFVASDQFTSFTTSGGYPQ